MGCKFASGDDASFVSGKGLDSPGALNTSVRGGAVSPVDCSAGFVGSNGADKIDPSIRQKVNVSSNVRLQVGQLFIDVGCAAD